MLRKLVTSDREGMELDCSQSSIFRKIIEIARFALLAAILHECQNYLGGGGGLVGSEKNFFSPPSYVTQL